MFMHKEKPARHPVAPGQGPEASGPRLFSASALSGHEVYNRRGEDLGDVRELMIDMDSGCVAYAVLSFGGFLSLGDKRFAVPWAALSLDKTKNRFVLNVEQDSLLHAPAFDSDHWPDMADAAWAKAVGEYYGIRHLGTARG